MASCFVLLSLAFFRQMARERGPATDQIFPAGTLIVGLAALVATIAVTASVDYGFDFAVATITGVVVELGIFVYMFFVLLRDGLAEEIPAASPNIDPVA
jgi:hypothetical protein